MKKLLLIFPALLLINLLAAQTNPAFTSWLQNTTVTGSYYISGNSTVIQDDVLANIQLVQYTDDWVYATTNGIPSYPTGPFLDGNPSLASAQNAIFRIPLNPTENTGTPESTTGGNIGIFINGVALFDFRDGVGWNSTTNSPCGGPGNSPCPGGPMSMSDWNRDAVPAEKGGFDCSKGHPAMGNYHHHQNPSAFKLDIDVVSDICNLYDAEGLYSIDPDQHSPLIGFAYDGFPIYGAYGFANNDGSGGIARIKSGYALRNITSRTEWADGTQVDQGPDVSTTYLIGYYREDYGYIENESEDYLDEHNGRFCVTPDYPDGIYAYFATVDEDWNSTYPYVVGPTFYGNSTAGKVTTVPSDASVFISTNTKENFLEAASYTVFPNPAQEFIAVQINDLVSSDVSLKLYDLSGILVREAKITQGSTIWYLDIETLYDGVYLLELSNGEKVKTSKVIVSR
jgi:hypothetical protein